MFLSTLLTIGMLFVAEGLLRLFNVIPSQIPRPVFHSNLLGDFDPNLDTKETLSGKLTYHIKTNSQGLRSNRELSETKPENTIRVLCIGDSFTYGTGVDNEYTYPAILSEYLEKQYPDKNIEVINAGVFLYDIIDEMDYYAEKGHIFKADFVVVQFYENDLEGMTRWFFRPHNNKNKPLTTAARILKQTALFNLATMAHFKLFGDKFFSEPSTIQHEKQYEQYLVKGTPEQLATIVDQDKRIDESHHKDLKEYWNNYLKALGAFKSIVEKNNARFIYVMISDEKQIKYYKNGYNHALNIHLNEMDVNYIDLLPEMRQLTKIYGQSYYNSPYDFHLNKDGYTLVAKMYLTRSKLL